MKCKILLCFTFSTLKFLSLANSFCSMEKLLSTLALWAEHVEVNCKQPATCLVFPRLLFKKCHCFGFFLKCSRYIVAANAASLNLGLVV